MNADIRRKLSTGFTVLTFSRAHPDSSAGFAITLKSLEDLVAKGEGLATQQRAGVIAERNANEHKRELRGKIQSPLLRHVAGVAAVAAPTEPGLPRKFRLPKENGSSQAFRTAARAMAAE